MASQTELEKNDMHQKLKCSEASQAHLSSMLSAGKQAHAAAVASLKQIQQGHSQQMKETKDQCDGTIHAMQAQRDRALLERHNMQECLEKERLAFRTSMTAAGDDRRDATWKSKMMKLRAELEQVKHERDSFKRQRK
ncbi:TPA: hypothetical protein ACH3X3_012303 [Trebouxia sp. C0006]